MVHSVSRMNNYQIFGALLVLYVFLRKKKYESKQQKAVLKVYRRVPLRNKPCKRWSAEKTPPPTA